MRSQTLQVFVLGGALLLHGGRCAAHGGTAHAVKGGTTTISFYESLMNRLGLTLVRTEPTATETADLENPLSFAVSANSSLPFAIHDARVSLGTAGRIEHRGELVIRAGAVELVLSDMVIGPSPSGDPHDLVILDECGLGPAVFDLPGARTAFHPDDEGGTFGRFDLRISPELARILGNHKLAGLAVGLAVMRVEFENPAPVAFVSEAAPEPDSRGGVLDVELWDIKQLQGMARDGAFPNGILGMAFTTRACNVGTLDVPWEAAMVQGHPFILQNLYRLSSGRLEQIGASDVKHGFFATNTPHCGACSTGSGDVLGPGCSDTYSVGNNSNRNWLAPRSEINPFAGTWDCVGTHFSGGVSDCVRRHSGASFHTPTEHMLEVTDADLQQAASTLYYEGHYIVGGDQNNSDNIGWKTADASWDGAIWNITTTSVFNQGAVIDTWGDSRTVASDGQGDVTLAVTTTDLGGGMFHYEYALFNFNLERRVRSFTLPVQAGVTISNVGFHDPDNDPGNDWLFQQNVGTIAWSTESFGQNAQANANIYGTMYNFRFDADVAPTVASVTLGLFKPGAGTAIVVSTTGPPRGVLDCNSNGTDDLDDISMGTSADCDMNLVPDECDPDCNGTGQPDNCDIFLGTSADCEPNGVPDECDPDCNGTGVPDGCDILAGTSTDCQPNGVPDECDISTGASTDLNGDAIPDDCQTDCNGNGVPDDVDISGGTSTDCDVNGIPDECDEDCNANGIPDTCDISSGTSQDVNGNGVPDECDCRCGDLNQDNIVNLEDFATFASCFGTKTDAPPPACAPKEANCSDFDQNGVVNLADFATFATVFGVEPPPPDQCFF